MIPRSTILALLPVLLLASPCVGAEPLHAMGGEPAVARPQVQVGNDTHVYPGTVFFVPVEGDVGAAAVGAAHSFDLAELALAGEVRFVLGRSQRQVTVSSRHLVRPGRPFNAQGASLRDDYVVFALDAQPRGVRLLELATGGPPSTGTRVRILGIPAVIPQDEDDVFGRVHHVSDTRIEVDLDVPVDLRGWGGAPVLDHVSGTVIGMLQGAWPTEKTLRVAVSPVDSVRSALRQPLDGGKGRSFAAFVTSEGKGAPEQPTSARAPAAPPLPAESGTAAAGTRGSADRTPATGPVPGPERRALLGQPDAAKTRVMLEIDFPYDGAIMGEDAIAFTAGRALALQGKLRRFDVVLVIDTSGSTSDMAGADINGNGILGENRLGGIFGSTDPGDSILAAEVAAARELLNGLDPRSTRVGLITFAGDPPGSGGGLFTRGPRAPAVTEEPLTSDYEKIERGLDGVLERGDHGMTHMAAGVDQATVELRGLRGALSQPDPEADKVALFFTDGRPTLPYDPIFEADNVKAVLRAADRARRAGVQIHSFAIGPEALDGPIATVEMAARTEGYFTPVRHPGDLVDLIEEVSFANLDALEVRNATTDTPADLVMTTADGSWSALVPLAAGKNRLEVTARAGDGTEAQEQVWVAYAPGAANPVVPAALLARRTRLLERRLVELRRTRLEVELELVEKTRQELLLEIEEERKVAQERAARQRKELELEAEVDPE